MTVRRPYFIAEQARNAHGLVGRLVAFIMARETWAQNLLAIDALEIAPADHVLDVGCGPGRALFAMAPKAHLGRIVGADPSELMVEIAVDRNRDLVRAGRVDVAIAGVEALPFEDASFDKVLCVHVIYFWPDLDAALREVARVLKPGGSLVLLFRTSEGPAAGAFPPEVYRFRPLDVILSQLEAAGLETVGLGNDRSHILLRARRRAVN